MTVKELIEKLKEFPEDLVVVDGIYWEPIVEVDKTIGDNEEDVVFIN